jgi:tRNA dimethylallyltransferase
MLEAGMIEETERAIEQGIENHISLASSVGYREVIEFLKNGGEVENLSRSITRSTRQLVSKQRKWFRKRFPQQSHFIIKPDEYVLPEDLPWVAGT